MTMLRQAGFRWFLPGLAAVALDPDGASFAEDLLVFHLRSERGSVPWHCEGMTAEQLRATHALVELLADTSRMRGLDRADAEAVREAWRAGRWGG